jgi:hypothetical protein
VPIDWATAAGLPPAELQDLLIAESGTLMAGLEDADEDAQLARLEEPLRAMWLLNWLDFEVAQGSLLAYFFNSHGRHAALAREVLANIGADRMADVLAQAELAYSTGSQQWVARREEPSDRGRDHRVVSGPYDLPNADELGRLSDNYWEAAELDDWGAKLDVYLGHEVGLLASRNA